VNYSVGGALWPHIKVEGNISFKSRLQRMGRRGFEPTVIVRVR